MPEKAHPFLSIDNKETPTPAEVARDADPAVIEAAPAGAGAADLLDLCLHLRLLGAAAAGLEGAGAPF